MSVVLDSSAVLALLWEEPGSEVVAVAMPGASISAVNFSEVVAKLTDRGLVGPEVQGLLADLALNVVAFDEAQALEAGGLRGAARGHGLSIGDRACLALGRMRRLPVFTADRTWLNLDAGVEIRLVR